MTPCLRPLAAVLLAALLTAASACVRGTWSRRTVDEPVPPAVLAALRPGEHDLGACLAALGAPNRVFEYRVAPDGTAGMALLWYWQDQSGWGIDVSSGTDDAPGSFEYDESDAALPGCMLWFGPDLLLERWRSGPVGDLHPGRVRPSTTG